MAFRRALARAKQKLSASRRPRVWRGRELRRPTVRAARRLVLTVR